MRNLQYFRDLVGGNDDAQLLESVIDIQSARVHLAEARASELKSEYNWNSVALAEFRATLACEEIILGFLLRMAKKTEE